VEDGGGEGETGGWARCEIGSKETNASPFNGIREKHFSYARGIDAFNAD